MVTWENYEEYMMLEADGELDAAGRQALQAFINANPALEEERLAFNALILKPDTAIVYPGKQSLLKKEQKAIVLMFRPLVIAAAAAAVGALILISALWPANTHKDQVRLAKLPHASEALPVPLRDTTFKRFAATATPAKPVAFPVRALIQPRHSVNTNSSSNKETEAITPLPIASSEALAQTTSVHIEPRQQEQGAIAGVTPPQNEDDQKSALPHIHLASGNQPAFNLLKQALAARVAQASVVAKSLKETSFTIKLGKGSVNFNL